MALVYCAGVVDVQAEVGLVGEGNYNNYTVTACHMGRACASVGMVGIGVDQN